MTAYAGVRCIMFRRSIDNRPPYEIARSGIALVPEREAVSETYRVGELSAAGVGRAPVDNARRRSLRLPRQGSTRTRGRVSLGR
jgi:hypothetical protein